MCGIAGAVGSVDPRVTEALRRMSDAQFHRGPDAGGYWADHAPGLHGQIAFGHRRLTIIDPRPESNQPFIDRESGSVICYNGEVYNFREIRRDLEREGVEFRTSSDTEVVLSAFVRWGERCFGRFRGMFGVAIWDAPRRKLVLARDRLGIKPVYYARVRTASGGDAILFASELRALLASGLIERKLDPGGLSTFLWNGFVVGPSTMIRGIRLLAAGTIMTIDPDGCVATESRYWSLPRCETKTGSTEELRAELEQAVRLRLISDVPLGVFLSGGIDSSALTALAARTSSNVRTITLAFDEAEYDESSHASAVARAIGTDHREIRLAVSDFRRNLDAALGCLDQPTFDAINTYFVSAAARESGLTVVLSGTGGDELFGGYESFVDLPRARRWAKAMSPLPRAMVRGLGSIVSRLKLGKYGAVPPQTRWGKVAGMLASRGDLLSLYQIGYALFIPDLVDELATCRDAEVVYGLPPSRRDELDRAIGDRTTLDAVSALELSCFIGERLLRDTDVASMGCSIEARVPLIDHKVVEAIAAVDDSVRFSPLGSKRLLRDLALSELDPALFDRPKSGFVLPIDAWCQSELRAEVEAVLHDEALASAAGLNSETVARVWRAFVDRAPGIYWSRVWALHVLLRWTNTNGVSV